MSKEQSISNSKSNSNSSPSNSGSNRSGGGNGTKNRRTRIQHGQQGKPLNNNKVESNNSAKGQSVKHSNSHNNSKSSKPGNHSNSNQGKRTPPHQSANSSISSELSVDDKFSGSSFHLSPNAATLPRPPFAKPASPPHSQVQVQSARQNVVPPPPMSYPMPFPGQHPMTQFPLGQMPLAYPSAPPMGFPSMGYPHMMGPPMAMHMGPNLMHVPPMPMNVQQPSGN